MKNRILVAAILIFLFAMLLYFWWQPGAAKKSTAEEKNRLQAAALAAALAGQNSNTVALIASNFARVQPVPEAVGAAAVAIAPAGPASPLQFTNFAPATVLQNVGRAIRQYGGMFGGNPVGTNPEITAALAGNNPRHISFLNADAGMRVDDRGEMIDPWGTPYFFHQLSGHEMEIRSAGQDRKMWTFDDLVAK